MKSKYFLPLAAIVVVSVALLSLFAGVSWERQIGGNSDMLPAPTSYTVVALPTNYQQDPLSQKFIQELSTDASIRAVREQTETRTYLAGHPILENMRISQTPALVVMEGENVLYKTSGEGVLQAGAELEARGITRHCFTKPAVRICPQCPLERPILERPHPKSEPRNDLDDPRRKEPELPNTPSLIPPLTPAPPDDHFVLLAVAVGVVGAVARYFRD